MKTLLLSIVLSLLQGPVASAQQPNLVQNGDSSRQLDSGPPAGWSGSSGQKTSVGPAGPPGGGQALRVDVVRDGGSVAASAAFAQPKPKPKFTKAPETDLKQRIIWGSECVLPDGTGLRFGGCDQQSDDGAARTAIRVDGQWKDISDELRKAHKTAPQVAAARQAVAAVKTAVAKARFIYFEGLGDAQRAAAARREVLPYWKSFLQAGAGLGDVMKVFKYDCTDVSAESAAGLARAQVVMERIAEMLDCEPASRALSPIAYDPKTKLFVLFGGDHLDYMTNDTWVFDPARRLWQMRVPKTAPPPRANHTLVAAGDGTIRLSGGITHNNTDIWYMGPLYQHVDDGEWVYNVQADTWTSQAGKQGVAPNQRAYRTLDVFMPEGFMKDPRPDAAANEARLKALPANTWVAMNPPMKLKQNRDWGTAVIDPDRDVMLRFSGGHSAHGGSDVPMYHFATNRWELPFPVEFPLGQTYSNTSYPAGLSFNRRPWPTGHTYKAYDCDPLSKRMVFVGHTPTFNVFDPAVGDWVARRPKPKGMVYGDCFYTLMCKRVSDGIVCWTAHGELFKYDGQAERWNLLKIEGEKLPGSSVDSSGVDYDARRDRVLLFPSRYGEKAGYNGQVCAIDLKELKATKLDMKGADVLGGKIHFLRETCYDAGNDLVLCGSNIPQPDGSFKTVVFDCARDQWKLLDIAGPNPAGKRGRDVSMGLMYDAKRKLCWSTDTNGEVYMLRLEK